MLEGLNEHQATEAMKIEMPKMVNDKYLKSLKEKFIKNPEKKHSFMMLGFKYFLHKWVNNEIIVEGIIPWKEFRKNSINALNKIKSETKKGEQIAVFSSGGTISSMIGKVLGIEDEIVIADLNFSVRNTSFSKLLYSNKETNLLTFNELPHLRDEMITFV
jgi:broad specificity phosphatase PhoE